MNYLFRVDFSENIGLGHLIRCLAIKEKLNNNKSKFIFVVGNNKENSYKNYFKKNEKIYVSKQSYVLKKNNLIFNLKNDFEFTKNIANKSKNVIIIVDNYKINSIWCKRIAPYCNKIVVINDIIKNKIWCDILLDQTFNRNKNLYKNFIIKQTELFVGHQYAILRKQFDNKIIKTRDINTNSIFLSMGGTDPKYMTEKILKILIKNNFLKKNSVIVLLNKNSSQINIIKNKYKYYINNKNIMIYNDVYDISKLMIKCFIGIGSGGVSAIERCKMGLPSLVYQAANNQKDIINNMEKKKLLIKWKKLSHLEKLLNIFINNPKITYQMSKNCMNWKIGTKTNLFFSKIK